MINKMKKKRKGEKRYEIDEQITEQKRRIEEE